MRLFTRSHSLPEGQLSGLDRWRRVPLNKRAAIRAAVWWNLKLRAALPMLPPDSVVFQSGYVVRTLWFEVRSLVGRIRFQLGNRTAYYASVDLPAYQPSGTGAWVLNTGTLGRIRGIEAMRAKYPWAASGDEQMFLEGWSQAEGFHCCSSDTGRKATVQASSGHFSVRPEVLALLEYYEVTVEELRTFCGSLSKAHQEQP